MRKFTALTLALFACQTPLSAAEPDSPVEDENRPVNDGDPDVVDVATTPLNDLNIRKEEIPQLLADAQAAPYDLTGLRRCSALIAEVRKFDLVLGDDMDLPQEQSDRISAGRLGRKIVGSFVPFRGIIREVSGANKQKRDLRDAVKAGIARRSFLKGVGMNRGCRYPARPASTKDIERIQAERKAAEEAAKQEKKDKKSRKDND